MDFEELIQSLQKRNNRSHGIAFASDYIKTIFSCDDGKCGVHPRDLATDEQWLACIKSASQHVVYSDDDMEVVEVFGGKLKPRGTKKLTEQTPGSCCDYITVMTSTTKDRQGDILETKGADPDPRMPALYQHVPFQPVGKLISTTKHRNRLEGHFAILDNAFGQDIARMIDFGMLRTSIGFQPLEWKQLAADEGEEVWQVGFHVLRFKILEDSLVSVPCQEDSIITAHSRKQFSSPVVKLHAQSLWNQKPELVQSGFEAEPVAAKEQPCKCKAIPTEEPVETPAEVSDKDNEQIHGELAMCRFDKLLGKFIPVCMASSKTNGLRIRATLSANELGLLLLSQMLKGEHVHPDLIAALHESLEQEKNHAQERAAWALVS